MSQKTLLILILLFLLLTIIRVKVEQVCAISIVSQASGQKQPEVPVLGAKNCLCCKYHFRQSLVRCRKQRIRGGKRSEEGVDW